MQLADAGGSREASQTSGGAGRRAGIGLHLNHELDDRGGTTQEGQVQLTEAGESQSTDRLSGEVMKS